MNDLSYFAGLFDGEGCVGWHGDGNGNRRFTLEVKMASENVIDWLQSRYGGAKTFRKRAKAHYKDQWRWRITGDKAVALYEQIEPLLLVKK